MNDMYIGPALPDHQIEAIYQSGRGLSPLPRLWVSGDLVGRSDDDPLLMEAQVSEIIPQGPRHSRVARLAFRLVEAAK